MIRLSVFYVLCFCFQKASLLYGWNTVDMTWNTLYQSITISNSERCEIRSTAIFYIFTVWCPFKNAHNTTPQFHPHLNPRNYFSGWKSKHTLIHSKMTKEFKDIIVFIFSFPLETCLEMGSQTYPTSADFPLSTLRDGWNACISFSNIFRTTFR